MGINTSSITSAHLGKKHPEWKKMNSFWEKNWKSYQGGLEVSMSSMLKKFYKENTEDYNYRAEMTPYLNFAKRFIEFPIKYVFSKDIISRSKFDKANVDNVDGQGTDLKKFNKNCMLLMKAIGKLIVVVDRGTVDTPPYCAIYLPQHMVNWETDREGIKWVLFEEYQSYQEDLLAERKNRVFYRYWSRDEIIKWEFNKDDSKLKVSDGFPIANPKKEVPIIIYENAIQFSNIKFIDYSNYDLLQLNRSILSVMSAWLLNIPLQNGILVLPRDEVEENAGVIDENMEQNEGANDNLLDNAERMEESKRKLSINSAVTESGEEKGTTRTVAPANTIPQHISSIQALQTIMREFSSIANLNENNESGVSKSYRFKETEAILNDITDYAEKKDQEICYHMENSEIDAKQADYKTTFDRDYQVSEINDEINELMGIGKTLLTNSPTFMKLFLKKKVDRLTENITPQENDQIIKEINEMVSNTNFLKSLKGEV